MKFPFIASMLCLSAVVVADEVILNDGTVYKDCVVESETDKSVTLIIPIGKTIKDTKTIAKDKIATIKKSTPDENDYADIVRRYGVTEGMTEATAKKGVEACEEFIAKYDKSKKLPDVKKLVEDLKAKAGGDDKAAADGEEAASGDAAAAAEKSEYSDEEIKKRGYDIDANKLLAKFKERAKENKIVPAMLVFDELSKDFDSSQAYAEARATVEKALPQLVTSLGKMRQAAEQKERDDRKKESEKTQDLVRKRQNATPDQKEAAAAAEAKWRQDLSALNDARAKRKTEYRDKLRALKEKKMRWFTPVPDMPESFRELENVAKADLDRVKREIQYAETDKAGKGSAALKAAWEYLDQGKLDEASEQFLEIRRLRIPDKYTAQLDAELKTAKLAAAEKDRAERAAEREKLLEERRKQQEARNKEMLEKRGGAKSAAKDEPKPADDAKKTGEAPAAPAAPAPEAPKS